MARISTSVRLFTAEVCVTTSLTSGAVLTKGLDLLPQEPRTKATYPPQKQVSMRFLLCLL